MSIVHCLANTLRAIVYKSVPPEYWIKKLINIPCLHGNRQTLWNFLCTITFDVDFFICATINCRYSVAYINISYSNRGCYLWFWLAAYNSTSRRAHRHERRTCGDGRYSLLWWVEICVIHINETLMIVNSSASSIDNTVNNWILHVLLCCACIVCSIV